MSTTSTTVSSPVRTRNTRKPSVVAIMMPTLFGHMTLNALKPKQQAFIKHIAKMISGYIPTDHDGKTTCIAIRRSYLKEIANDINMSYAPAWIVKTTNRAASGGYYMIPELNECLIVSSQKEGN